MAMSSYPTAHPDELSSCSCKLELELFQQRVQFALKALEMGEDGGLEKHLMDAAEILKRSQAQLNLSQACRTKKSCGSPHGIVMTPDTSSSFSLGSSIVEVASSSSFSGSDSCELEPENMLCESHVIEVSVRRPALLCKNASLPQFSVGARAASKHASHARGTPDLFAKSVSWERSVSEPTERVCKIHGGKEAAGGHALIGKAISVPTSPTKRGSVRQGAPGPFAVHCGSAPGSPAISWTPLTPGSFAVYCGSLPGSPVSSRTWTAC